MLFGVSKNHRRPQLEAVPCRNLNPTSEVVQGRDFKSDLQGRGGGERRGEPASEASLPPEASQVVAEGDGLPVLYNTVLLFS